MVNRSDFATRIPVEGGSIGGRRRGPVAQTVDPDKPGFESWLCYLFTIKSSRDQLTCLCLSLLTVIQFYEVIGRI